MKIKKSNEEVWVEILIICYLTFMLKTQCLTYDSEKLERWHTVVSMILTIIVQRQMLQNSFYGKSGRRYESYDCIRSDPS